MVTLQTPGVLAGLDLDQAFGLACAAPRDEIAAPGSGHGFNVDASRCQPLNPHAGLITRQTPSCEHVVSVAKRVPDAILDEVVVADGSPLLGMDNRLGVMLTKYLVHVLQPTLGGQHCEDKERDKRDKKGCKRAAHRRRRAVSRRSLDSWPASSWNVRCTPGAIIWSPLAVVCGWSRR